MTSYVAVIPSIHPPSTQACMASCKMDSVVVVDNTEINKGIAASWNVGVAEMYARDADWTIIVSAGVRFGAPGGLDLIEALAHHPDALVVEAGDYIATDTVYGGKWTRHNAAGEPLDGFGMHLIAYHRRVFDEIGTFDENIYPGYMEDTDFWWRMKVAYALEAKIDWQNPPHWNRVPVEGRVSHIGHGADLGQVDIHVSQSGNGTETQLEYYLRKWGGFGDDSGAKYAPHAEWTHPFNDENNPLSYWPPPAWKDRLL